MALRLAPPLRASIDDVVQRAFAVELGIVIALFVAFTAYTITLDMVLDPYFLDSDTALLIVRSALVLAGMGVLATSYAAWREYSLSVSLPDRADGRLIVTAIAGTAVLATLPFLLLAVRMDVGVSHVTATVADLGGVFLTRPLIRITLFVAGMVILYHGFVQGALQRVIGHDRNLAVVVTTLLGGYMVAPNVVTYGTFATGPWLFLWGPRAAVAVLFVFALGVAVYATKRVDDGRMHKLAMLPAMVTLGLTVLVLSSEVGSPAGALVMVARVTVVGVAAYAYNRTESIVSPALVYATYAVVSTVLYSAAVAAALGS